MDIKEKFNFGGWDNCIYMSDGEVEVVVTTDVGPRIVRFGFVDGKNIFGEMKDQQGKIGGDDWMIYGGHRLWHSPEAKPRTYYPDNKPLNYIWNGEILKLTQNIEETTGIQKEMEINLVSGRNSVEVVHRLINYNLWEIEVAPWTLTVMAQGGRAVIPHEPYQSWEENLLPVRSLVLWGYTEMKDPRWIWGNKFIQLKQDPDSKTRQKIGILNTLGWMTYYLDGVVFIKRYDYDPKSKYPDFGVNSEVYTDKDILELETLGRLAKIQPEASVDHVEKWFLFKDTLEEDEKSLESKLTPLIKKTDTSS